MLYEMPESKDVIKGELAERGEWTVAIVTSTTRGWPVTLQHVTFCGHKVWVLPLMKDRAPALAVNRPARLDRGGAERLLMRLASSISWATGGGILIEQFMGGSRCFLAERREGGTAIIRKDFDLSYLPEPQEWRQQVALALMREARSINHGAYAFLNFYRVLEVAVPDGKRRTRWLLDHVHRLTDRQGKEAVAELRAEGVADVAEHLAKSGRHAIAHAANDPIINPDDPTDLRRLHRAMPIISALAELAIEQELGIETPFTVYDKHLYELAGFKQAFGADLVRAVTSGQHLPEGTVVNLPCIDVELRMKDPYPPLCGLEPKPPSIEDGKVTLYFQSTDGNFGFGCTLDFAEERLHFDISKGVRAVDDQTADGAERLAEIGRFYRDYWSNGELRIVDSETRRLVSRKDAFMPVNCYLNQDAANAGIEKWKAIARERAAAASPADADQTTTSTDDLQLRTVVDRKGQGD